jgi:hypothetical protein
VAVNVEAQDLLSVEKAIPTVYTRNVDLVAEVAVFILQAFPPHGLARGADGMVRVHAAGLSVVQRINWYIHNYIHTVVASAQ